MNPSLPRSLAVCVCLSRIRHRSLVRCPRSDPLGNTSIVLILGKVEATAQNNYYLLIRSRSFKTNKSLNSTFYLLRCDILAISAVSFLEA